MKNLMKPPVARKLAVGHMCPTASFLATGGFPALHYSVDFIFLSFGIMGFVVEL